MFKTITNYDLADAVRRLLLDEQCCAINDYDTRQAFVSDLTETLCAHIGGEATGLAKPMGPNLRDWVVPVRLHADVGVPEQGSAWEMVLLEREQACIDAGGARHVQLDAQRLQALLDHLLRSTPQGIDSYQVFITDIADVLCRHCGGETVAIADLDTRKGVWNIWIARNDSLSDDGGIWADYDPSVSFAQTQDSASAPNHAA